MFDYGAALGIFAIAVLRHGLRRQMLCATCRSLGYVRWRSRMEESRLRVGRSKAVALRMRHALIIVVGHLFIINMIMKISMARFKITSGNFEI